jgi:kinesin family member 15
VFISLCLLSTIIDKLIMADELDDDGHIRVICRVRPENARERKLSSGNCIKVGDDEATMSLESKNEPKTFCFDYSANDAVTQEEIFERVGLPITTRCIDGYNGTILCYGQTGSGKVKMMLYSNKIFNNMYFCQTYTMFGSSPGVVRKAIDSSSDRGLVPRVLEYLWTTIGEDPSYKFSCSFYEIYQEKIFDLLDVTNPNNSQSMGLTVREDATMGVYVEGCTEEKVNSLEDASKVLFQGYKNRHVSETAMNRQSSRSHAVFQLHIEHSERNKTTGVNIAIQSRFSMVDLAGSERATGTQATGTRLKEANTINKSLTCLGRVINELIATPNARGKRKRHINYRDSKLTFLLRDSLGGNSKVSYMQSCYNRRNVSFLSCISDNLTLCFMFITIAFTEPNRLVCCVDGTDRRRVSSRVLLQRDSLNSVLRPAVHGSYEQRTSE